MTFLLGGIAAVSLLVGGIGTERTREIGIRMAVGARRPRAVAVPDGIGGAGVAGGLGGILVGLLVSFILFHAFGWPQLISPVAVAGSAVFSMGIGIFFGYYAARKAANLDPIAGGLVPAEAPGMLRGMGAGRGRDGGATRGLLPLPNRCGLRSTLGLRAAGVANSESR